MSIEFVAVLSAEPAERKVLEAGPGVRMELLAWGNTVMEPHLFRIAPQSGSGESYHHEGEEFLYVLQGELQIEALLAFCRQNLHDTELSPQFVADRLGVFREMAAEARADAARARSSRRASRASRR